MLHSLSAQVSYYSKMIQSHNGWMYCGVYSDEAVTGTKRERAGFQHMIEECRQGNIDLVITKSISRFARNTVTLLQTVRELKSLGVDVFFEEQHIHTMSADGELMMTILASYAQEESLSASENQKWRVRKAFENGEIINLRFLFGYTRTVRPEYAADGVEFVDYDTLLRRCDILSLHCPATPQTRGLVNAEALAKMKPGAILLNTARGALVDEEAVAAALHSGQLGFYGADAFVTEPLPQESPLRAEHHAILTPHIAWTTREALQNLMDITTRNLRTWLEGNGEHIVNR